ncbi:hypothetical protein R1sor_013142 [Riccia sorocarpa]|uniref:Reverse transcriptase domain-containing protein n=1 Tax=Riccia sorocarpa TaxID=122646 RepID=A0ABD3H5V5_9MARC
MLHDGSSGLSDHYPVVLKCQLVEPNAQSRRKWRSYFKFRTLDFHSDEAKKQVKETWESHPPAIEDLRARWELAWSRVKRVLAAKRREQTQEEWKGMSAAEELAEVREKLSRENTSAVREKLSFLKRREEPDTDEAERNALIQANLNLVTNHISGEQSRKAEVVQDLEELERIVALLPSDKSPGLDGVTSEAIKEFWPGGRSFDSILAIKLGQEWADVSNQKSFFLKLDFIKAYDRVSHNYLWQVLGKMGFGRIFITLIEGLATRAGGQAGLPDRPDALYLIDAASDGHAAGDTGERAPPGTRSGQWQTGARSPVC